MMVIQSNHLWNHQRMWWTFFENLACIVGMVAKKQQPATHPEPRSHHIPFITRRRHARTRRRNRSQTLFKKRWSLGVVIVEKNETEANASRFIHLPKTTVASWLEVTISFRGFPVGYKIAHSSYDMLTFFHRLLLLPFSWRTTNNN